MPDLQPSTMPELLRSIVKRLGALERRRVPSLSGVQGEIDALATQVATPGHIGGVLVKATDPLSSFRLGTSIQMAEPGAGWPYPSSYYGMLTTNRFNSASATQWWAPYQHTANPSLTGTQWYRHWHHGATDWGPWYEVPVPGHKGIPYRMAAGSVSVDTSFPTITFPVGRFTQAPIVTAQLISGAGADIGVSMMVTSVTESSFRMRHSGASGVSKLAHWTAVQMTEGDANG